MLTIYGVSIILCFIKKYTIRFDTILTGKDVLSKCSLVSYNTSSGETGTAVGKGNRFCGTSCSDTIHFKSAEVRFFLEATFSSKHRATCSAEMGEPLASREEESSDVPGAELVIKSCFSIRFCDLLYSRLGSSLLEL